MKAPTLFIVNVSNFEATFRGEVVIINLLINVVDVLVEDEMVVNDVVTGDLREEDGGVPADVAGSVLSSVGFMETKIRENTFSSQNKL